MIFTNILLRRVEIHKVVFFVSGDKVGEEILNSLTKLPKKYFYIILHNPTAKMNLILDQENLLNNVIYSCINKPAWDEIADKLAGLETLRGFSWFPFIFPKNIITILSLGIVNLHNSFLPYNRGRHSTFWGIMDGSPLGASLHWVEEDIDSGSIIDQIEIKVPQFSNASVIYNLQLEACIELANKCIPNLFDKKGIVKGIPQDPKFATLHYAKEIELASSFNATSATTWENVVTLIRATSTEKGFIQIKYSDGVVVKIRGSVIEILQN